MTPKINEKNPRVFDAKTGCQRLRFFDFFLNAKVTCPDKKPGREGMAPKLHLCFP